MSNVTVVQPDLIYLDEARALLLSERALEGSPTLAIEIVIPSTAHLVAQYGATSGDVTRPQPELRLTTTPAPRAIIAGRKCRMVFATVAGEDRAAGSLR